MFNGIGQVNLGFDRAIRNAQRDHLVIEVGHQPHQVGNWKAHRGSMDYLVWEGPGQYHTLASEMVALDTYDHLTYKIGEPSETEEGQAIASVEEWQEEVASGESNRFYGYFYPVYRAASMRWV